MKLIKKISITVTIVCIFFSQNLISKEFKTIAINESETKILYAGNLFDKDFKITIWNIKEEKIEYEFTNMRGNKFFDIKNDAILEENTKEKTLLLIKNNKIIDIFKKPKE